MNARQNPSGTTNLFTIDSNKNKEEGKKVKPWSQNSNQNACNEICPLPPFTYCYLFCVKGLRIEDDYLCVWMRAKPKSTRKCEKEQLCCLDSGHLFNGNKAVGSEGDKLSSFLCHCYSRDDPANHAYAKSVHTYRNSKYWLARSPSFGRT